VFLLEIHVHIHGDEVKEGRAPKKRRTSSRKSSTSKPKRKGKPMTGKNQRKINAGRRKAGLKPIKWKKKGR